MESIYAASTTHTNSNNAKVRGSQSPSFFSRRVEFSRSGEGWDEAEGGHDEAAICKETQATGYLHRDPPKKRGRIGVKRQNLSWEKVRGIQE